MRYKNLSILWSITKIIAYSFAAMIFIDIISILIFCIVIYLANSNVTVDEWSHSTVGITFTDVASLGGLSILCIWKFGGINILRQSYSMFRKEYFSYSTILGTSIFLPLGLMVEYLNLPDNLKEDLEISIYNPCGLICICLIGPLAEELLFRGVLLNKLLEWKSNPCVAIILSSAIFGVFHLNPAQIPGAFLLGLVMGYVVYKTGCIFISIVIHCIFNSLCCIQYFMFGYDSKALAFFDGNWMIYLIFIGISLLGMYFILKKINLRVSLI